MTLILGTLAMVSLAICFLAHASLLAKLEQKHPPAATRQPISILKPLKGRDPGLYENLAALAAQDYPDFEILFCAEDALDEALVIARQVQADFPNVPMRVLSGAASDGLNPKVRILRRLLPETVHEWVLVSDSNVRPEPGYLQALIDCQQAANAGLVHSVLSGVGERSWGARLENVQMNSWIASSIAFCDAGQHPCVIGKSMLMSKTGLGRVGGFDGVKDILAEDYVLGSRFTAEGFTVALSPHVLPVVSGARDLGTFVNRHVRWGQMRRHIKPVFFVGEVMINPLPFFLLLGLVGGPVFAWISALGMALKWAVDACMYWRVERRPQWRTLLCLPFKDLLTTWIWAWGGLKTRVSWRGNEMRVGPGSRLYPLEQEPVESGLGYTPSGYHLDRLPTRELHPELRLGIAFAPGQSVGTTGER